MCADTRDGVGRKWRRSDLTGADGLLVPDDWCRVDEWIGAIARIYKTVGGPRGGQWFWAVQIDEQGRPWNGGTGYCDTGREAKETVEKFVGKSTGGG